VSRPPLDRRIPGTRLGLAFIRAISDRHGGTTALDDHDGPGTTFRITSPPSPHPHPLTTAAGGLAEMLGDPAAAAAYAHLIGHDVDAFTAAHSRFAGQVQARYLPSPEGSACRLRVGVFLRRSADPRDMTLSLDTAAGQDLLTGAWLVVVIVVVVAQIVVFVAGVLHLGDREHRAFKAHDMHFVLVENSLRLQLLNPTTGLPQSDPLLRRPVCNAKLSS
jgi:hypothetical protein